MFHGANLVPESLETGEYKVQTTTSVSDLSPYYIIGYTGDKINILGTEYDILSYTSADRSSVNGIPTTIYFLATNNLTTFNDISYSLGAYGNQSEYVVACFTVPGVAVKNILNPLADPYSNLYVLYGSATATTKTLTSTPATLDGYSPKNAKTRQYPYLYLGYNPPNGTSKVFRYEDFTSGTPSFKIISEVNPNPSVYFIPQNYRGTTGDSLSDNVSLNGYPQLSSRVDVYNSWLAENTGIINVQKSQLETNALYDIYGSAISMFSGIAGIVGGGTTKITDKTNVGDVSQGMLGSFGSTVNSALGIGKTALNYDYNIQMINAQKEKQAMLPDNVTLGGSNATLLGYGLIDDNIFTTYSVKYQFAKRIDDYFSMFRLSNK